MTILESNILDIHFIHCFSSFSAENNGHVIDIVYYLQNYPGGWENGEFREKMDIKECINPPPYHKNSGDDLFKGPFWTYNQIRSKNMECLSVQGTTRIMAGHIEIMAEKYKSFMLDRYVCT